MKNYKTILFDLDGTLSNSKEGITKSVQYALAKLGINVDDLNQLEHFIGPPLKSEFMKSYNLSDSQADEATAYYRERYIPIGVYETDIYPGMRELLEKLKNNGYVVALATSKPQMMAEKVLRHLDIIEYFDYIKGADLHGPIYDKTDVITALFLEMNYTKEDKDSTVMIGDTSYDVIGANDTGIDCIGVGFGFGDREDMLINGAITVVEDAQALMNVLIKERE